MRRRRWYTCSVNGELVGGNERRLFSWGIGALCLALAGRLAFGWFTARQLWLLDSQALLLPLAVALAVFAGLLVGGELSRPVTMLLGLVLWGLALSLIPRSLWWQSAALRAELPAWLRYAGVVVLLLALIARAAMTRRWMAVLRGHGFQWIQEWAAGKPYFARLLALIVLRGLGFRA